MKIITSNVVFLILIGLQVCDLSSVIVVEDARVCFQRLLAGQRISPRCVLRRLFCERLEDCRRECEREKRFVCEGFNYRLDQSGRGQGICELTEVPLSRLNFGRDYFPDKNYDYYERDRNSYPDCSGTRPLARPWHFGNLVPTDYDSRRPSYHGPKDHSKPYDSFENWNRNQLRKPFSYDHRYDWKPVGPHFTQPIPWGAYGGQYGHPYKPSQGDDRYDYWGFKHIDGGTRYPLNSFDYRNLAGGPRPWDNYWGLTGWGYGRGGGGQDQNRDWRRYSIGGQPGIPYGNYPSYKPGIRDHGLVPYSGHGYGRSQIPPQGECHPVRAAIGVKIHRAAVLDSCFAAHITECERRCREERRFQCCSFSYGSTIHGPLPNCLISDRRFDLLDAYHELEPDSLYDIYSMREIGHCDPPRRIWPDTRVAIKESECFIRLRSGQRLAWSAIRDSFTASSVGQCELACVRARHFICKTFTYRYSSAVIGSSLDNCLLSDCPFSELRPGVNLQEDPGFELYERGSVITGCQLDGPKVIPIPFVVEPAFAEKVCYLSYGSAAKLLRSSVRKAMFLSSELDCRARCSSLRKRGALKCMSFSFRSISVPGDRSPNCLLSDIDQRDLRLGLDYVHEPDHWLFAWNLLDERCRIVGAIETEQGQTPGPGPFPLEPLGLRGRSHEHDPWQQYSVSGWPCRRGGGGCQHNVISGHYACELEGGEATSWDYCCAPDHRCGYSEGFDYAWCYVGPNKSQWRKCADRYYPYGVPNQLSPTGPPPRQPPIDHRPVATHCCEDSNQPGNHPDQVFLSPPVPGGFGEARYWPVAYLHSEIPPSNVSYAKPVNNSAYENQFNKTTESSKAVNILVDTLKSNNSADSTIGKRGSIGYSDSGNRIKSDEMLEFDIVDNISIGTTQDGKLSSRSPKQHQQLSVGRNSKQRREV